MGFPELSRAPAWLKIKPVSPWLEVGSTTLGPGCMPEPLWVEGKPLLVEEEPLWAEEEPLCWVEEGLRRVLKMMVRARKS